MDSSFDSRFVWFLDNTKVDIIGPENDFSQTEFDEMWQGICVWENDDYQNELLAGNVAFWLPEFPHEIFHQTA